MGANLGKVNDEVYQGVKCLKRLRPLLKRLRPVGCARDRAQNRKLFFDRLCGLVLLTFFNPSLKSLRDLERAGRLKQVRKKLGGRGAALGSLSEALRFFDPQGLAEIAGELLAQVPESPRADPRLKGLGRAITAVDGTLLRSLPQITQACYGRRRDAGWKLHAEFEVLREAPTRFTVTDAGGRGPACERAVLRAGLTAGRCYVMDRGYEEFSLFNAVCAAGSDYVCRIRGDHGFEPDEVRPLSAAAQKVGVTADAVGRLGSLKSRRIERPDHRVRRIVIRVAESTSRGGRRAAAPHDVVLATNLLDAPAEVVALIYRRRWLIELFFRWFKCVLSCRHLLSESARGIEIQTYCGLIACLLIQLACPSFQPDQWTYKLLCLYQQGWATEAEVLEHLRGRSKDAAAENKPAEKLV